MKSLNSEQLTVEAVSFNPKFDEGPGKYRIGLILLSNDYATERDFINMRPSDEVTYFCARIPMPAEITPESLRSTESELERAAAMILPGGRVDAVAYSCTSASVVLGHERVQAVIQSALPGVPCITPIDAALTALELSGAKKISVLTPYIDSVNALFVPEFARRGFDVRGFHSFKLISDLDMANLSPQSIRQGAIEADREDSDAVFISCTAIRAVEVIEEIEQVLGKPVVSSIQAMFWQSLQAVGYKKPIQGYGKLLATPPSMT